MEKRQQLAFIAIAVGLVLIGGVVGWSMYTGSGWLPRDFGARHPEEPSIQELLISGNAGTEYATLSEEQREIIKEEFTPKGTEKPSRGVTPSDHKAILSAWGVSR